MYLTSAEAAELSSEVAHMPMHESIEVAIFPNTLDFSRVAGILSGTRVKMGAQNVAWVPQGAYTGATSAVLFAAAGATHALVGHSERRHVFGESKEDTRKKMEACIDANLIPVLCMGETKQDREEGKREYRLKNQMISALQNLDVGTAIIAYEPVWAISSGGEGEACDPQEAEEVHAWIKEEIKTLTGMVLPVIYGGSVDEKNVLPFTSCSSVDGVLVGHASTHGASLLGLIQRLSGKE